MMIYLSADVVEPHSKSTHHHHHHHYPQQQQQMSNFESYDLGGVRTNFKRELTNVTTSLNGLSLTPGNTDSLHRKSTGHFKDVHWSVFLQNTVLKINICLINSFLIPSISVFILVICLLLRANQCCSSSTALTALYFAIFPIYLVSRFFVLCHLFACLPYF